MSLDYLDRRESLDSSGLRLGIPAERVHVPGDASYDGARMPWNVAIDQRPAAMTSTVLISHETVGPAAESKATLRINSAVPQRISERVPETVEVLPCALLSGDADALAVAVEPLREGVEGPVGVALLLRE